jgi:hypothetical protein
VDVLADQLRSTLCCTGAVPVPVRASVSGEPEAFVVKETVSDAEPLACGLKVMMKDAVWPDAIVRGSDGPLRVNSELLTEAAETVTAPPLALRVAVMFLLDPTTTLPKLKLVGLTENPPTAAPVPDNEIVGAVLEASEVIAMLPLALPLVCGAKTTLKVKF